MKMSNVIRMNRNRETKEQRGVDITVGNDDLTQLDQEQGQEHEWTEWSDYVQDEETASESEVDNDHQEQDNESDDKVIPMKSTADEENEGKDRHTTSKDDATAHGSAEHPKANTHKTRHVTEIAEIIGYTEDLQQFDNLRHSIKIGRRCPSDKLKYNHLLAKLQVAIQQKRTSIMEEI